MRHVVIPGEIVGSNGKKAGSHVFKRDGNLYSDCIGLVNDRPDGVSVIALEGPYMPQIEDVIVGVVDSENFAGYIIDVNSFCRGFLPKREMDFSLKIGDVVSVKIASVTDIGDADLSFPRLLSGGEIIDVSAVKVPRIIGKEGSMLNVIKQGTGCTIVAGRNGRLWVKGGDISLLHKTLGLIESEAHTSHLTDKVTIFLGVKSSAALGAAGAQGTVNAGDFSDV